MRKVANKHTDKQTNNDEDITSLAEVIMAMTDEHLTRYRHTADSISNIHKF